MAKLKMRKTARGNLATGIGTVIFFTVFILLSQAGVLGSQIQGLIVPIGIYIILAVSLNLTVGVLGELSLGHAGFMCIGAYVGGVFSIIMQQYITSPFIRFPLAILIGGLTAGVMGLLIGIPVLRLRGDYLAIVTLGFGEIMKSIANNIYIVKDNAGLHFSFAAPITDADALSREDIFNGPQGISAPGDTDAWVVLALLVVTLFVVMNFMDSRQGRACMAIRDNCIAAESVGVDVTKYRLMAFSISAFFAGIAGVLYSHSLAAIAPKKFDYNLSILILVFVVLGGLGNIRGSVIATVILYALPEIFRDFMDYRMLIYAIVLILMMIFNNSPSFEVLREKLKISKLTKKIRDRVIPGGKNKAATGVHGQNRIDRIIPNKENKNDTGINGEGGAR